MAELTGTTFDQVSAQEIRAQLDRILHSADFAVPERNRRLLRFIVEETLSGHADRIKAYYIAVEVFGRGPSFDPQADPVVRIEAGNLRRALERFYLTGGRADAIVISIPKGGYVPLFTRRDTRSARRDAGLVEVEVKGVTVRFAPEADANLVTAILNALKEGAAADAAAGFAGGGAPKGPPSLSVMVPPFASFGNDPVQRAFADSLVDDLTVDFSRIPGVFVLARDIASRCKGGAGDAARLCRELGLTTLLDGTVRQLGDQVRVNVALIDAASGGHLFVERFDGAVADLPALHEEITSRLPRALHLRLVEAAAMRPVARGAPDAADLILRGRAAALKPRTRENALCARRCFEQALALAPGSLEARIGLAEVLASTALSLLGDSRDLDLARAGELVASALADCPRSAWAHFVRGEVMRGQRRLDEAAREYEETIALDPRYVPATANLGFTRLLGGAPDEALPLLEQAVAMSRHDPLAAIWQSRIGIAEVWRERFDPALAALEIARSLNGGLAWGHFYLAAGYGLVGRIDQARASLAEAQALAPVLASVASYKSLSHVTHPRAQALRDATLVPGLRLAGLPDG